MLNASELLKYSSVVRRVVANPDLNRIQNNLLETPQWDDALLHVQLGALGVTQNADAERLAKALRQLRSAAIAALATFDAQQSSSDITALNTVTGNMTALADFALHTLLIATGRELALRYGIATAADGQAIDVQVVAMGKHGGRELNVSSDIDIIFLARDLAGDTAGVAVQGLKRTLSNSEFLNQWARRCVSLMNTVTADGFIFRVDTMLRPHGSAGPLVTEHASLENYLLTHGRMWERLAWLKARAVYTPVFETLAAHSAHHSAWQALVAPFVYRRYLDFTVIDALRDLHAMIRAERRRFESKDHAGIHVKLARGGIREIEFWVQGQQLIRGGRQPNLRTNATLPALQALAQAGEIESSVAQTLSAHYTFLRRAEHAVQYIADAQTHVLPADDVLRSAISQFLNAPSLADFDAATAQCMGEVAGHFDALFAHAGQQETSNGTAHSPTENSDLAASEISNALLAPWLDKAQALPLTDETRLILVSLLKQLDCHDEVTLARVAQFILSISKRKTYLHLLRQHPPALGRLHSMMGASVFAAQYIQEHPALIDELIDGASLYQPFSKDFWQAEHDRLLTRLQGLDEESQMDALRETHHAWVLKILAQDVAQQIDVRAVSDALSAAADLALDAALCCVHAKLMGSFSLPAGLGVLAYGKLGGKELGYGSDLDVVFVLDAALAGDSAPQYPRLVQRLISWLGLQTVAGRLFEIDTALRPNGQAGLMLTSMTAFANYQLGLSAGTKAWVWEHQALSRARLCAGDRRLEPQFDHVRDQVLQLSRDETQLRHEIAEMRQKVSQAHLVSEAYFDPKHSQGGMVDIEFAVQYLVLRYAADCPALLANIGNVALLKVAAQQGYIQGELASSVGAAYMALRTAAHTGKLAGDERAWVLRSSETGAALLSHVPRIQALWAACGLLS